MSVVGVNLGVKSVSGNDTRIALADAALLGLACLVAYWAETHLLARIGSVSRADDLLGGMCGGWPCSPGPVRSP